MMNGKNCFQKQGHKWLLSMCLFSGMLFSNSADAKLENCAALHFSKTCKGSVTKTCPPKKMPKKIRVPTKKFDAKCFRRLQSICIKRVIKAQQICKRKFSERFCSSITKKAIKLCAKQKWVLSRRKHDNEYKREYKKRCLDKLKDLMATYAVQVWVKAKRKCKKKMIWLSKDKRHLGKSFGMCECKLECPRCIYKIPR